MSSKYELCVCIPTFNRSEKVYELVQNILKCTNEKLTVAVLDNASTDDTITKLKLINDVRLNIYSNPSNQGSLYNFLHVLDKASDARFALFCLDKDKINANHLDAFITELETSDFGAGYVNHEVGGQIPPTSGPWIEFSAGYESIRRIAYLGRHPSGYFFNVGMLSNIHHIEKYSDKNLVGLFPFEFILADILVHSKGGIYQDALIYTETLAEARTTKSFTIDGNSSSAYFHPKSRSKQFANFSIHALKLQLSRRNKMLLLVNNFKNGMLSSTLGYRAIMQNEDICIHHHMNTRSVSFIESIYNGFLFSLLYLLVVIRGK
ncbi:glycosyltransferase [Aeromonas veronii]|uniref:glycosyltransferase n=1 Tax=Aeromonas veronii TaxID=654 RepID=UPI001316E0F0|nr:glycosyltransferase [Aeromonas veronii]QHC07521.1 glycosyltransferase [Aeromonas veronii]